MLCRLCDKEALQIIDFGIMPIANYFRNNEYPPPETFRMIAYICDSCKLFQLMDQPAANQMFNENYPFFTSLSSFMREHFRNAFAGLISNSDKSKLFVVEIGSNDGTFLINAREYGIKHLGIEPSKNVFELSESRGICAINSFFDDDIAKQILEEYGHPSHIYAANVICHIGNLHQVFGSVQILLNEEGKFIFEEPYLLDMIKKVSFDQIYDEHVFMFSLISMQNICDKFGLELFDAEPLSTHGGSMRFYVGLKGANKVSKRLYDLLEMELDYGLDKISTYLEFAQNCIDKKSKLVELIRNLQKSNVVIGGYAATSKSTTILNFCGLSNKDILFISDSTEEKIGTKTPLSNIPIISHREMREIEPDYLILFAWNHRNEILEKERGRLPFKTKWIMFTPKVEILSE